MASTVTLNGRTYAVDYGSEAYRRQSIPLLRRQSDQGTRPGSQSLNPEGPWRRTFESWHRGEGQTHADREASDPARFNDSAGVDPWNKYELTLLPAAGRVYTATSDVTSSLVVGQRLYVVDGNVLTYSDTPASGPWTTVTGSNAGLKSKLATDGERVWFVSGQTLFFTTKSTSTAAVYHAVAFTATNAWYAKARLLIADTTTLSSVADSSTAPTLLATLPTGKWVDVTEGRGFIYAAASSQSSAALRGRGEGTIYRIGIKPDGSGLDVPVVAAKLPAGEDALSIYGYLGFLMIGTSKGVRFAQENGDGSLTLGALRMVQDHAVSEGAAAFTAEDRFIYACQSAIDGSRAGLTRFDLSEFIAPLTPAAASDLTTGLSSATNAFVTTCGTYDGKQFFAVGGSGAAGGVWFPNFTGGTGTLTTGVIDYGISESKVPLAVDLQTVPLLNGMSVSVAVSVDGGAYTTVGAHSTVGASFYTAPLGSLSTSTECRYFQVRVTLTGNGFVSPALTRITLRTYPVTDRGEIIQLPVILGQEQEHDGLVVLQDASVEVAAIKALTASKQLVTLVEGDTSTQVYVEDYAFQANGRDEDGTDLRGTMILKLKSFA